MKVRVRAQTIRLRLGQVEIDRLRSGKRVEESISFGPDNEMIWSVELDSPTSQPALKAAHGSLRLKIPRLAWVDDESAEGYGTTIESAPGYNIKVTVERDYACLTPRDSVEDRDSFPHPDVAKGC